MRAAIASWAKVSALDSRVGAPPTPFWEALILRPGGIGRAAVDGADQRGGRAGDHPDRIALHARAKRPIRGRC